MQSLYHHLLYFMFLFAMISPCELLFQSTNAKKSIDVIDICVCTESLWEQSKGSMTNIQRDFMMY
jgi:hypothetical protein